MSSKIYRAGAIGHTGAGNFGHDLHKAFWGLPNVQMIAIADADAQGREEAWHAAGAEVAYADYREMLAKEPLDMVAICPRHMTERLDMVRAAAEAGCHIYCEKPFAISLAEADEMLAYCAEHQVRIAVAHQSRYIEPFQTVRRMIEQGEIGQVLSLHGRGKEDHRGGGEDMLVLGTHIFDLMRFLVGDPAWVSAHITCDGRPAALRDVVQPTEAVGPVLGDHVTAMFGFSRGVRGYFVSSRDQTLGDARWGLTIVGTAGAISIRYSSPTTNKITVKRTTTSTVIEDDGHYEELSIPMYDPTEGAARLPILRMPPLGNRLAIVDLIEAVEEKRDPVCSGDDGRFAIEMVQGVYAAHLAGCNVTFPMTDRQHPLL